MPESDRSKEPAGIVEKQIVILFGAGASKGATHITPSQPPLGKDLYDRLAEEYPKEWGPESHLGFYSDGLRQDFERTMSDEVCQRVASIAVLEWQRPMALYFARFAPDGTGDDLYSRLLSFLREHGKIQRAMFGSLNYDCIFEQASVAAGFHVDYLGEQGGTESIKVLKIHGSCNFVTKNLELMKPHLSSPGAHVECGLECLSPQEASTVLAARFRDYAAFCVPVMSLYALGKDSLVAPVQIQSIRNRWNRYATEAVSIYIIGVRPNEGDTHIWIPIKKTTARMFYIGGRTDYEGWLRVNPRIRHLGETFEGGFESLLECLR